MSDAENNGLSPAKEENPPEKKEEEEPMEEEEEEEVKEEAEEEKKEEQKEEEKEEPPPKKSPKKGPKKTKKQAEEDEEEEEEPRLGLLERPVVIESGKREKKKVERLEISLSVSTKEKKFEIPEGKGTKLGDIPRVEFQVTRTLADDLKPLHRILYGRNGLTKEVKKNIRKFCGFAFTAGSDEYEKKRQALNRFTTAMLKATCENLDLERNGTKDNIIERILDFLLNPTDSGRPLPQKRRGKSAAKGTKRKRKPKNRDDKDKGSKKKAKSKEAVDDSDEEDEDDEDDKEADSDEEDASEEESASESEEEDAEEPPKKKTKGDAPKKAQKKENKKKETKKAEKKEKKAEKKEKKEKKSAGPKKKAPADSDESSDDDEPLVAKKQPPNDDELRDVIKKILDGANLEEVTMKTVCKQVYAKYPDFDLTDRKDFIKSTVKQIIR